MQYIQVLDSSSRTHMPHIMERLNFTWQVLTIIDDWTNLPLHKLACCVSEHVCLRSLAHLSVYTKQIDVYSHLRINSIVPVSHLSLSLHLSTMSVCVCFSLALAHF